MSALTPKREMHATHIKKDSSAIVINVVTYILVTLFCLMCILPFWMIIASSFSSEEAIRRSGFTLWPAVYSTYSYELLFRSPDQMIGAYIVTICLAGVGTLVCMFLVGPVAGFFLPINGRIIEKTVKHFC